MSRKITDRVQFCLNKHGDANSAERELVEWTTERQNFLLSKLDWMQSCIDKGNSEGYRIAFNQLNEAIKNQKNTLDKLHSIMLFEQNK